MVPADSLLRGGTANYGRVFRHGDTVHRPSGAHTPAVHALLRHLASTGFRGAPAVVARDDEHEVLQYIEGIAASEPLAPWAGGDEALASVGRLLRGFHDASAGFDPSGYRWQRPVPERWRGPSVTHNDVNPGNVVFRDGQAVALIDFDLAAPGSPAWELAVAACCWVPLRADADIADERTGRQVARLTVLLDGYGADAALRADVVAASSEANAWMADVIREASHRGHPAFGRLWQRQGLAYARADTWLRDNRVRLTTAAGRRGR